MSMNAPATRLAVVETGGARPGPSRSGPPVASGGPRLPDLPPSVLRLVQAESRRGRYSEAGEFLGEDEDWRMPEVDPAQLSEVRHCLGAVEKALAPPDRGQLLTRVLALLSHYRADPNPPQVERAMAEDWAEDLGEFPMWAVEEAARWWRRNRKFRPAICEMRALCELAMREEATLRNRLRAILRKHDGGALSPAERFAVLAERAMRRMPGTQPRRA